MKSNLYTIAAVLDDHATNCEQLAPAEMHGMAVTLRSLGDQYQRAMEQLNELVRTEITSAHIVRLDPAMVVLNGGKCVLWDYTKRSEG